MVQPDTTDWWERLMQAMLRHPYAVSVVRDDETSRFSLRISFRDEKATSAPSPESSLSVTDRRYPPPNEDIRI